MVSCYLYCRDGDFRGGTSQVSLSSLKNLLEAPTNKNVKDNRDSKKQKHLSVDISHSENEVA